MANQAGERYRCESCGAEIVYVVACPCPPSEPKRHSRMCCDVEMKRVEATRSRQAEHPHHA